MEIRDMVKICGVVEILHFRDGKLINKIVTGNLLTNAGLAQMAGLINGVVTTPFTYVAVGTGTTAPSVTDTALVSEVMRVSATVSRTTTSVPNDTATWSATFNFTSSYALAEAGIFDASTGGNMLCRVTYPTLNVVSGDSLIINWKVQIGRA
jgi:hypothetical protein